MIIVIINLPVFVFSSGHYKMLRSLGCSSIAPSAGDQTSHAHPRAVKGDNSNPGEVNLLSNDRLFVINLKLISVNFKQRHLSKICIPMSCVK